MRAPPQAMGGYLSMHEKRKGNTLGREPGAYHLLLFHNGCWSLAHSSRKASQRCPHFQRQFFALRYPACRASASLANVTMLADSSLRTLDSQGDGILCCTYSLGPLHSRWMDLAVCLTIAHLVAAAHPFQWPSLDGFPTRFPAS